MVGVIIVAAGNSSRMNGVNKITAKLKGKPIIIRTLMNFETCDDIDFIVVVTRKDMIDCIKDNIEKYGIKKVKNIVEGGNSRQESVYNGLRVFSDSTDIIVIHDGARPFVSKDIISNLIDKAKKYKGAIVAVPVKDTIKMCKEGVVIDTIDRKKLYSVQTPQAFCYKLYKKAIKVAIYNNLDFTDDSQLFENIGQKVVVCEGDYKNIKITTKEDLDIANSFLGGNMYRVGHGYDVHRLVKGRKLILGGVEIPNEVGLLGHSDADVLIHAIIDAIIGAMAKGDIGKLFPDNSSEFKDISSLILLKRVMDIVKAEDFCIENIDATIVLQEPRLRPYIDKMRDNIARVCGIYNDQINIKATTEEGLGFSGNKEGVLAHSVVMLQKCY